MWEILGSAVIGAFSSLFGAKSTEDATKANAEATLAATKNTNAMLQRQYDQNRKDNESWRLAGEEALKKIQSDPGFQFVSEDFDFFSDPSYEFRKQESINALDRSAASRGNILSGAQNKAITRYAGNLASQEYGNAFNRYMTKENQRFNQQKNIYDTNLNTQKVLGGLGQQAISSDIAGGTNLTNAMARNTMNATNNNNALRMQGAMNTADMYGDIATSTNKAIANKLLYDNLKD